MAVNRHISGMHGVFLVAAKLSEKGFIVSPTLRNAAGADLLVTDQHCRRAFTIQVKANSRKGATFFLIGKKVADTVSKSHIYVLVDLWRKEGEIAVPRFFIVPSRVLLDIGYHDGKFPNIKTTLIAKFKDRWKTFGSAT